MYYFGARLLVAGFGLRGRRRSCGREIDGRIGQSRSEVTAAGCTGESDGHHFAGLQLLSLSSWMRSHPSQSIETFMSYYISE